MSLVPQKQLQALRLISDAIGAARAGNFDALEETLDRLTEIIPYLDPAFAEDQRRILGRIKTCYRQTPMHSGETGDDGTIAVVVTPVLNGGRHIDDTIASVVGQRGEFALRYHVQDGGSTDGTVDILRTWEIRLKNGNVTGGAPIRFSWCSRKDGGMYDAVAAGFELACRDVDKSAGHDAVMSWVNSGDLLSVNAIWTACCFMAEHPEVSWITGMGGLINESGAAVRVFHDPPGFSQPDLAAGRNDGRRMHLVQQAGSFWRWTLWQMSGGLSRDMKLAGDRDLWRRFATITPLIKIETLLGLHRRRSRQLSRNISGNDAEINSVSCELSDKRVLYPHGFNSPHDPSIDQWVVREVKVGALRPEDDGRAHTATVNVCSSTGLLMGAPDGGGTLAVPPELAVPSELPGDRAWPQISVVTPSFNQGRYIGETIDSVIAQGYPNLEYIVVDGGSTDETLEVLARYRDKVTHLISERDRGQSHAINKGFRLAKGEIFCWLNSDDRFAPGALFAVAMAFSTHDVDMVSGICEIYAGDRLLHRHMTACADGTLPLNDLLDLERGWNAGQFFYQPEVFFSRALWERAGAYVREDCYYSMDYELWCRFALGGAKLHVIGKSLARFRQHPEQKTADPERFKAELISVRDQFVSSHGLDAPTGNRPPVRWDRILRVAIINDLGPRYGAGIAQARLAAGIEMAGHDVAWFCLDSSAASESSAPAANLTLDVTAYRPDAVIFGNLHACSRESITLVEAMSARFPTFWVTHDFWLFTGRCAYTGSCDQYLRGCDDRCPTPAEYPDLAPGRIADAWERKRRLLSGSHPPIILANSAWSLQFVDGVLRNLGVSRAQHLAQIKLGAPGNLFRAQPRAESRIAVGLSPKSFVVAFSASTASDKRKGGHYLVEALRALQIPDLAILVIGNLESPLELNGVEIVSLGYLADTAMVVTALSAADLYVGPSAAETFGQVFIEAALAGIPSIGFDQTGVIDAIANGITGLRVDQSAQTLGDAIKRLYEDRELLGRLGGWARIYAANEFTLESSFHSLFNAWRSLGLVDKWALPHKVDFVRSSRYVDDSPGQIPVWQPVEGLSSIEGPYPTSDIPTTFRWCHGAVTTIRLNCSGGGPCVLRMSYYSNLFDSLNVKVYAEGQPVGIVSIVRTAPGAAANAMIFLDANPGWNRIQLRPDRISEPTGGDSRALSFMLREIELSSRAVSALTS